MSKNTADDLNQISVSVLNRHHFFSGWKSGTMDWTISSGCEEQKNSVNLAVSTENGNGYLRIYYTQTNRSTDERVKFDYKIPLTSTPCRYGGRRYWFTCPWYRNGIYCGRRVGSLYLGGDQFACRHCYNLTYKTRNQSGIYKGFVSIPDLEKAGKMVKRYYYRGKLTRKYRRFVELNYKFEQSFKRTTLSLLSKHIGLDGIEK